MTIFLSLSSKDENINDYNNLVLILNYYSYDFSTTLGTNDPNVYLLNNKLYLNITFFIK